MAGVYVRKCRHMAAFSALKLFGFMKYVHSFDIPIKIVSYVNQITSALCVSRSQKMRGSFFVIFFYPCRWFGNLWTKSVNAQCKRHARWNVPARHFRQYRLLLPHAPAPHHLFIDFAKPQKFFAESPKLKIIKRKKMQIPTRTSTKAIVVSLSIQK